MFLRIYLAAAGSRLNLPGTPNCIIVGIERDADGTLEGELSARVTPAGYVSQKDLASFRLHRRAFLVEDATTESLVAQISDSLASTGAFRLADQSALKDLRLKP